MAFPDMQETDSSLEPSSGQRLRDYSFWARLAETPRHSRAWSLVFVAAMVGAIGWVDYLAGVHVSLGLFYLIPIACSVAWLGWREGALVAVACVLVRMSGDLAVGGYSHPIVSYWNRLIDLGRYLFVVWTLHALLSLLRDVEQQVRLRTVALEKAIDERNKLQKELFEISRRERSAVGHDLHDGLGQHLTATSIAANLLAQRLERDGHAAAGDARVIGKMLQEGIANTRQIARGLLLAAIAPAELVAELEELADRMNREHRAGCQFLYRGNGADRLDVATSSHLFYVAQEAARNAVRHAQSTRLNISLVTDGSILDLSIADNGRGVQAPKAKIPGMGLRIMAHRTELIGGKFAVGPHPGGGTIVRCRVPLPVQPPETPSP
jgi:signal transduction histidine kinase